MDAKMRREVMFGIMVGFVVTVMLFGGSMHITGIRKDMMKARQVGRPALTQGSNITVYEHLLRGMEYQQQERKQMIKSVCEKLQKTPPTFALFPNKMSLYNEKYSFTICRMMKVASSTWLRAVMVPDGFYTRQQFFDREIHGKEVILYTRKMRRLERLGVAEVIERWKRYTNIITVRNPFGRVLSAYMDKMINSSDYYHRIATYIETSHRHLRSIESDRHLPLTGVPTFEDFVNFLVSPRPSKWDGDAHWMEYSRACQPCHHQYDVVIKLETIAEDVIYLREKLGVEPEDYPILLPDMQPHSYDSTGLFATIPRALAIRLYNKYRFDFEAFGYERPNFDAFLPAEAM